MPLWLALALPSGLMLLLVIGLLLTAQRISAMRLIDSSGNNLLLATSEHIRSEITGHLESVFTLQLSLAGLVARPGVHDAGDMRAVEHLFDHQFSTVYRPHFPQVEMIQFGSAQGEFFGLKQDRRAGVRRYLKDQRTGQRLIARDEPGPANEKVIVGYDPRVRPWYRPAAGSGLPRWTPVYLSSFGDVTSISATTPVKGGDGQLLGVLATDLSLSDLSHRLRALPLLQGYPSALVYVVDEQGHLLAHSHAQEEGLADPPPRSPQIALAQNSSDLLLKASFATWHPRPTDSPPDFSLTVAGQKYLGRVSPLTDARGLNWQLVALVSEGELIGSSQASAQWALMLALGLAGVGLLLGLWWMRRIAHPIHQAAQAASELAQDRPTHRVLVDHSRIYETALLTEAFNAMSRRILAQLAKLHDMALRDAVTGLPNRRGLIAASEGLAQRPLTVLLFGVDRFRAVNASLGPSAGDELLRQVGHRLRAASPAQAVVARVAGDEFLVLWPRLAEGTEALIERLQDVFKPVFLTATDEVLLGASLGVVQADGPGLQLDPDLLRYASVALQVAKAGERGQRVDFDACLLDSTRRSAELVNDMRAALAQGEFTVHFQPIVRLQNQALHGLEALLRWNSPKHGMVGPAQFIPLAEESGLIVELGQWVLRQATQEVAQWMREQPLPEGFLLHVNVSQRQLVQADFGAQVAEALRLSGLPPHALAIEITESLLVEDDPATLKTLADLHAQGVRMALDDFGTGYSSLSYLNKFQFFEVKIDRSFIVAAEQNPRSAAILKMLLDITRSLDAVAVAEGIETPEQAQRLLEADCLYGQGYWFGRPMPLAELRRQRQALATKSL
ncbi:EAL domain-containing protein [Curvibacter sp. RS43]|uniref:bifunctional diguanylate cyclase/phosphodiesterase n=1 Tax=Curvibacter microcysteis TaxID=3026419 RepID=UPI00235FF0F1|nr:EAL domain-containing protein [Curvibacter sp. RS43]MDD0810630.1 EAL domain-containing protein [Curvibacter sp. RS43]